MKKCKGDNRFGIPGQCNDDAIEEYGYCEYHLDPSVKAIRSGCRDIVDKLEEIRQATTLKLKSVDPMDHYTDRNGKTWRGYR